MKLTEQYREELVRHGYVADLAQTRAVERLEALRARLGRTLRREASWWWRLKVATGRTAARRPLRGIYLWGGVGRGKTLLMDLFCRAAEELGASVRRTHFHRFMHDVHARLTALRPLELEDPVARVAADIAADTRVLCFDELFVTDIADAMLLAGLFAGLIKRGVTLVVTSNVAPAGLYRDGLQRSRFLPAIALLERATEVVEVDGGTDYRLRQLERAPLYVVAGDVDSEAALLGIFTAIARRPGDEGGHIEIEERPIVVRRKADSVVWFAFSAVCEGPRSTDDYIEIARQYHTVLLSGVPVLDSSADDAARRFVALVDEFYERGVKLVLSAAAQPERLYRGKRLAFEFARAASRLTEMQSHDYLARPHLP